MSENPQNRRQFPRLEATLEVRLLFSVLMLDAQASATDGVQRMMVFAGHTRNLSEAGLAVVVRARNIAENYLVGGEGTMRIELDLPDGPLELHATPVRYEQIDEGETERGYLIGAHITSMSEADRERFRQYLRTLT